MTVQHRPDTRTCTACKETQEGGYVAVVGAEVLTLCPPCLRRLERLARAARRKAEKQITATA